MKVCTYSPRNNPSLKRMGILCGSNEVFDPNYVIAARYEEEGRYNAIERAEHTLPPSLHSLLTICDNPIEELNDALEFFNKLEKKGNLSLKNGTPIKFSLERDIILNCPMDKITTYRDFYAHEKHVAKGFEKRNEPIPPAWYEIPAYYKGATSGFIGPEEEILWPSYTNILDYELELGMVIGRDGRNIKAKDALKHVFGYTILNDISARDIQKKEMAIRLGPAKGKDFCTVIGPVITTADEFKNKEPNLLMTAKVNGEEWSRGQSGDSHFSWQEMIEHVSMDEWVLAGDLFGSGTVGTGCGLELDKWILENDVIEMEVESIGILKNKVGKKQK